MSIYPLKIPRFIQSLFPNLVWRITNNDSIIYLTFDDGPTPHVTDKVLDILNKYNAKATFFCIGKNVVENPEIYQSIIDAGHQVGNHTHNHKKGWITPNNEYYVNLAKAETVINTNLFRPPYGRIKPKQVQFIKQYYKIIMWEVLSGDFDPSLSKEKCLNNVLNLTESGSIVVFHDSIKASERMLYALPKMLEYFTERGYKFAAISF